MTPYTTLSQKHCILPAVFATLQAFMLFDSDGDGCISVEEVGQALQKLGVRRVDAADAMLQYDTDHDGQLNYREFLAMMAYN